MKKLTDEQAREFVENYGDKFPKHLTEAQARALAAKFVGVTVERVPTSKNSWNFIARFHKANGPWYRRYAGKSLHRALTLRLELVATFGQERN